MNKQELVDTVAENTGEAKSLANKIFDSIVDTIKTKLSEGEKVTIPGLGTFEVKKRAARKGRNPSTGAEIDIPAKTVPSFKAGKELKDIVNLATAK